MKEIIIFFNTLRQNSAAIWLEQETIKLSTPKQMQNEEAKNFLTTNKEKIIRVLKENTIFSKEAFLVKVILRDPITVHYPLSHAQERLWFIEQYQEGTNAYHIPSVHELEEGTDIEGIKYALQQIVSRHEVLRSTIEQREDQAVQIVHSRPLEITEVTLTDDEYVVRAKEDINRPFNLTSEYPIRVRIYTILSPTETQVALLINIHHIASDGWSTSVFRRELMAYYEAYLKKNLTFRLPELEIQYKDYAVWQRAYLSGETLENQLRFWREKLASYQTLKFPTDRVRPNYIDYRGAREGFSLSTDLSRKLRQLVKRHGTTLHSVMLSGLNVLFNKYTGQDDIIIGSTIANRHHRQTEDLIGFFVNTQVNRTKLTKTKSFHDLIDQVHKDQVEIQLHQDLPFEKLINELGVERDTSRHPVFQVMFGVHGFKHDDDDDDIEEEEDVQDEVIEEAEDKVAKFDLSIHVNGNNDEITGNIGYAVALFHKNTIIRLARHFEYLLQQLADYPDRPHSSFNLIRPEEYEQMIHTWNRTDVDYPNIQTIHEAFQDQANKSPNAVAVIFQNEQLTYCELNERSNQLAHHIRKQYAAKNGRDLKPGTLVALCVNRSLDLAIGVLGILKSGASYVPIDPSYPKERIDYILDDAQTETIVLQSQLLTALNLSDRSEKFSFIDLSEGVYRNESTSQLTATCGMDDLAYLIYTSGTTGKPKGAMITHRSVCNYNNWMISHKLFAEARIVDCSSSIAFDATVNVLITPLCCSQTVVICPESVKQDVARYVEHIGVNNIELIKVTPSYFNLLLHATRDGSRLPSLKCVIVGGEKANKHDLLEFTSYNPHVRILHHYGPTETTVGITSFTDFADEIFLKQLESVPLGKVASNNRAYVLNQELKPVPIGTIGELYIAGANLSTGYWNKPEITNQRFIENIFATAVDKGKKFTKLYKTGDLVRWIENGLLEFIGRNDDQVKIRGYRIELGEVEHFLKQIPGIKQGCVIAKERRGEVGTMNYLVGYFVTDDPTLTQNTLQEQLGRVLPEYMIPDALVKMHALPLTVNGKLDKKLLPDPYFGSWSAEYAMPATPLEEIACTIWQEVVGVSRVGTTDDFFKIGGNSILAILVSHRMSKSLNINIKVADIFKYKNIKSLLEHTGTPTIDSDNVEWQL